MLLDGWTFGYPLFEASFQDSLWRRRQKSLWGNLDLWTGGRIFFIECRGKGSVELTKLKWLNRPSGKVLCMLFTGSPPVVSHHFFFSSLRLCRVSLLVFMWATVWEYIWLWLACVWCTVAQLTLHAGYMRARKSTHSSSHTASSLLASQYCTWVSSRSLFCVCVCLYAYTHVMCSNVSVYVEMCVSEYVVRVCVYVEMYVCRLRCV